MKPGSHIQQEIRQGKPFASKSQEAVVALFRTADVLRGGLSRVFEPHGITGQQYNVLRILRGAGTEGLPTLDVAERMIERTPGITRLLDRLERKGLVRRERCARDRRQILCWIQPAGLRLLDQVDGPLNAAEGRALAGLGVQRTEQLLRLLELVREGHG